MLGEAAEDFALKLGRYLCKTTTELDSQEFVLHRILISVQRQQHVSAPWEAGQLGGTVARSGLYTFIYMTFQTLCERTTFRWINAYRRLHGCPGNAIGILKFIIVVYH